jgi:hypothetical protein
MTTLFIGKAADLKLMAQTKKLTQVRCFRKSAMSQSMSLWTVFSALILTSSTYCLASDSDAPSLGNDLSQLESALFDHDYKNEDASARLDRLERFVFGEVRTGSDQKRISQLLLSMPPERLKVGAGKSADSRTTTPEKAEQENPVAPEEISEKVSNDSDDARIKKLEQKVLGKTYESDMTQSRIDRLEKAEFGSPSNSSNIGDRLTLLEAYAGKPNLSKERTRSQWSEEEEPQQTDTTFSDLPRQLSTKNPEVRSLTRRVGAMEVELFGRSYPDKPLLSRIQRLEKAIGVDQKTAQEDLPSQVDTLWAKVGPGDSGEQALGTRRSYKTRMAPSVSDDGDVYSIGGNETVISGNGNWDEGQTQTNGGHQSWLHKLGRMLGGVGSLAAGALESPSFYPYGYGGMNPYNPYGSYMYPNLTPGWGYGGYYPNLPGSPWGGNMWGGSPWGGSPWGGSPWGGSPWGGSPWGGNTWGTNPFGRYIFH